MCGVSPLRHSSGDPTPSGERAGLLFLLDAGAAAPPIATGNLRIMMATTHRIHLMMASVSGKAHLKLNCVVFLP